MDRFVFKKRILTDKVVWTVERTTPKAKLKHASPSTSPWSGVTRRRIQRAQVFLQLAPKHLIFLVIYYLLENGDATNPAVPLFSFLVVVFDPLLFPSPPPYFPRNCVRPGSSSTIPFDQPPQPPTTPRRYYAAHLDPFSTCLRFSRRPVGRRKLRICCSWPGAAPVRSSPESATLGGVG